MRKGWKNEQMTECNESERGAWKKMQCDLKEKVRRLKRKMGRKQQSKSERKKGRKRCQQRSEEWMGARKTVTECWRQGERMHDAKSNAFHQQPRQPSPPFGTDTATATHRKREMTERKPDANEEQKALRRKEGRKEEAVLPERREGQNRREPTLRGNAVDTQSINETNNKEAAAFPSICVCVCLALHQW